MVIHLDSNSDVRYLTNRELWDTYHSGRVSVVTESKLLKEMARRLHFDVVRYAMICGDKRMTYEYLLKDFSQYKLNGAGDCRE